MRRLALGAALALVPVAATAADCTVQWRAIDGVLSAAGLSEPAPTRPVRASGGGGCTVSDLTLLPDAALSYRVRSLTWSGDGIAEFVTDGTPPSSLALRLAGVRAVAAEDDAAVVWILDRLGAQGPSDVGLSAAWDSSGRLLIETSEPGAMGARSVWVDAAVEGVDLTNAASARASAGTFRVTSIVADIGPGEAFARFLVAGLGADRLQGSDDPAGDFDALRGELAQGADGLPDAAVPVHSRVALKALLADLPDARGRLVAEITAPQGFGPANLLPLLLRRADGDSALAAVLSGLRADLRYDR